MHEGESSSNMMEETAEKQAQSERWTARKVTIRLRTVAPRVPDDEEIRKQLDADLMKMGCDGLREHSWDLRNEGVVREVLINSTNKWDYTLRVQPDKWTAEVW